MSMPTLEDSIARLVSISGVKGFDPDTPLTSSAVDSLDLTEWVYTMQEDHPELGLDESIVGGIDDTVTFRSLYQQILADLSNAVVATDG